MGEVKWTTEQRQVIEARDCDLLVTAAAGSGKTSVLIERILSLITDPARPVNVDELLIVTFTDPAAREMKERLLAALEKIAADGPAGAHIERQKTLVHNAQISTLHSFCLSIIRDNFQKIDLDPSFVTMVDGEEELMKQDVLDDLLEKCYTGETLEFLKETENFTALANALETGRDDKRIETCIRTLYNYAMGYPDPEGFLEKCRELCLRSGSSTDNPYLEEAVLAARDDVTKAAEVLFSMAQQCENKNGPSKYTAVFQKEAGKLEDLLPFTGYADAQEKLGSFKWGKLPPLTAKADKEENYDPEMKDYLSAKWGEVKKGISHTADTLFYADEREVLKDLSLAGSEMTVLLSLTEEFIRRFAEEKRSKNRIDFSDMEHLALQILYERGEEELTLSDVAQEYHERFSQVMVDEYQDSSYIQEAILKAVSGGKKHPHDRFMVGDVKQSIYSFRQARPDLFLEKFQRYSLDAGSVERRIDLHQNFRSRRGVVDAVNTVFSAIMKAENGGIDYTEEQALLKGARYPDLPDEKTRVYVLEADKQQLAEKAVTARQAEAAYTAALVLDILEKEMVTDKKTGELRRAQCGDIAILTREGKEWSDRLITAMNQAGIPAYAQSRSGFFAAEEIQTILHFLRLLDNPYQDIPLAAILHSPIGGFSSEELGAVRSAFPKDSFALAAKKYAETEPRMQSFFELLNSYRERMTFTPLYRLIADILEETGYIYYAQALPGGRQRKTNLEYLVKQAMQFEKTSYRGVFSFLRYLEQLGEQEIDFGEINSADENSDVVQVMTIHKSKGLEYPIVIVAGLGSRLHKNGNNPVDLHRELGAAVSAVDLERRIRTVTLAQQLIRRSTSAESLGEEIRILYVAMTRAKEHLYLLGKEGEADSFIAILSEIARDCPDVFELQSVSSEETLRLLEKMQEDPGRGREERVQTDESRGRLEALLNLDLNCEYDSSLAGQIRENAGFAYPHEDETALPVKRSVSEIKKQAMQELLEQEGEMIFEEATPVPLIPQFMKESGHKGGAFRGTVYHRFLEFYDYRSAKSAKEAAAEMLEKGILSEEMVNLIGYASMDSFFESRLGRRMKDAALKGTLRREQLFVIKDFHDPESIVQGIIDAYFEENGKLVLIDYKTDRVSSLKELTERYRVQLVYYAHALEQLTHKPVTEAWLYSFSLGAAVSVEI